MKTNELSCSRCGNSARYNHPSIRPDGSILCESCADNDESGEYLIGVDQHTLEPCGIYTKNGIVVWHSYGHSTTSAWILGGTVVFPLYPEEQKLGWKEILDRIDSVVRSGRWRCTRCGGEFSSDEVHYPKLFAGRECEKCHAISVEETEREIENGDVCSRCGKPYSECYC